MPAELGSLLLADARLPTGSYAHSGGLEPAVAAGLTADQVPAYLLARLRTVARVEAAAAVLAHRAARMSPEQFGPIQAALAARTPSAPLRAASRQLGRGLARLAVRQWPGHPAARALAALGRDVWRPVALGALAALLGLSEEQTARASAYEDAQTVAAAALKLLPVDPADVLGWLLDAAADIDRVVREAAAVADPDDLPAPAAPMIELYSLDHHHRDRRIFVA